jgi:hypothetical protein
VIDCDNQYYWIASPNQIHPFVPVDETLTGKLLSGTETSWYSALIFGLLIGEFTTKLKLGPAVQVSDCPPCSPRPMIMSFAFDVDKEQVSVPEDPVAMQGEPPLLSKGELTFAPETAKAMMFHL